MAKITKEDVGQTVRALSLAGKRMPIDSGGTIESATNNVLELVDLWYKTFSKQEISQERWKRAEEIALVARGVPGLNTNVISMALMDYALEQDMKNHLATQESKAKEDKSWKIEMPEGGSFYAEATSYIIKWTAAKIAGHSTIMDALPSDLAVHKYAGQLGVRVSTPNGENTVGGLNFRLLQTYLADAHHCKTKCDKVHCYMHKMFPKPVIKNGEVHFELGACGQ